VHPTLKAISVACVSILLLGVARKQHAGVAGPPPDACAILKEAIGEVGQIKPGMTRREVEEHFQLDGGLQFRNTTRYIYPKCREVNIKVEIEFNLAVPADQITGSPDDTVVKVSTPYLDYPARD
jgi:hypothetical protein